MNDDGRDQEIVSLQARIAYQDKTIADLSDVVYRHEQRLEALEKLNRAMSEQLRSLGFTGDPAHSRPPHF